MSTPLPTLPYGRHAIDEDDIAAVRSVLCGDWLTTGPAVRRFETALAERTGAAHAVSCANGTAALHLACLALDLKAGECVIVPAITFSATANAARLCGADVVFADVDPDTGLMEAPHLTAALADAERRGWKPRIVLPVHLAGQCADMAAIAKVARAHGLAIVEDACHAIGTVESHKDGSEVPVGACAHSDMTVFSFHPVKTIAAGEGGAVTTENAELAERLRRLRGHGIVRDETLFEDRVEAFEQAVVNPWYYEMIELGLNYRLSDINCALALSQMQKLDRFVVIRRALAALYDASLARFAPILERTRRSADCLPAWHLYTVLIDFEAAGITRGQLMRDLETDGIRTQVHYIPVPRQPYYRKLYGDVVLPGADAYYRRTLSLPLYVGMTGRDVERVTGSLERLLLPRAAERRRAAP
ncbi:MAG TPA: UDP-4-amino-4,6-dideoxy-N-acetyl-beta-L-altrosamine transaminase [Stellaceae bacterium]|nr:UDP-4-amino-4,6-dideoxy-N-acetyl-beta-L-altrosamine transaminase [Stellaceae bacterium]